MSLQMRCLDGHHRSFDVGDMVYIKLQLYRQSSIALRRSLKLSAKFYGPFEMLQRTTLLKKHIGVTQVPSPTLPYTIVIGDIEVAPRAILESRMQYLANVFINLEGVF
ncbi:hypothetical protein V2J09_010448 [Rumex salicifolius]